MSPRLATLLYLFACASVAANAANSQYVIERSLDDGASWTERGTVVVTGSTVNAAKARFTAAEAATDATEGLSAEDRKSFLDTERIYYRVREEVEGADATASSSNEIARVVTTPCTIVRGFNIKNTKEVELLESLNVVITKGSNNQNKVTGLQVVPRTNLHHTSTSKFHTQQDTCDKEVLALFPKLTVGTTVGVSRTTVAKRTPKYEESLYFSPQQVGADATAAAAQQQQQADVKLNEDGKPVDADGKVIPEPDNRSFFEKYWHYILMFVLWNVLQNFINPAKKEGAAAGGAAPAAAAAKK